MKELFNGTVTVKIEKQTLFNVGLLVSFIIVLYFLSKKYIN